MLHTHAFTSCRITVIYEGWGKWCCQMNDLLNLFSSLIKLVLDEYWGCLEAATIVQISPCKTTLQYYSFACGQCIKIQVKLQLKWQAILLIFAGAGHSWTVLRLGMFWVWIWCLLLWSPHICILGTAPDCGDRASIPNKESKDFCTKRLHICGSPGVYLQHCPGGSCAGDLCSARLHQHPRCHLFWRSFAAGIRLPHSYVYSKGTVHASIFTLDRSPIWTHAQQKVSTCWVSYGCILHNFAEIRHTFSLESFPFMYCACVLVWLVGSACGIHWWGQIWKLLRHTSEVCVGFSPSSLFRWSTCTKTQMERRSLTRATPLRLTVLLIQIRSQGKRWSGCKTRYKSRRNPSVLGTRRFLSLRKHWWTLRYDVSF